ncbi:MAG: hypothetical protein HYX92_08900 [Chloroflexi bacterium]|nr:hypothetical protein [Chloroflexota bacterium]
MKVVDLTVDELKALIKEAVEEALENVLGEPGRTEKARQALREIQEAFRRSGITEEELQEEGRRVRHELVNERYGPRPQADAL